MFEAPLHQVAEVIHQGIGHGVDQPRPLPLTAHQSRPLQLAELATDVGLAEARGFDQGGHIHGTAVLELTEQLQAGRLAQVAEEGADEIPTGRPLVVVCHSGSRSALATQQLLKAGRQQVANLRGGLSHWAA